MHENNSQSLSSDSSGTNTRFVIDRRDYLRVAGGAISSSALGSGMAAANTFNENKSALESGRAPQNLQAEYEKAPNNISPSLESPPRLTWELPISVRDYNQSAFRILVATSESALDVNQADVWDSGKVSSKQSTTVHFDGADLQPGTTYYWKVRVWDGNDNPSPWSTPSAFTTVLPPEEWTSEWIQADLPNQEPELLGVEWSDYTLETEFTVENAAAGLVFRASDRENLYFWQLALDSYDAVNSDEHLLRPHVLTDGSFELIDEIPIGNALAGAGESNQIRIGLSGSEITTTINGKVVDTRSDTTHSSGTIGFRQYGSEEAKFDSVRVSDSSGDVLFSSDFESDQHHFSRGTIQDGHLHIDGTGTIVVPYEDPPRFSREDPSPLLRSEFNAQKEIEQAKVHVCGPGFYELYLNGDRVGQRVLDPARTNYNETVLFSTFDVTDHLQKGTNAVGVALGHGRPGEHDERTPVSWEARDPALRSQIEIEFTDGGTVSFGTDESWLAREGPTRWDSLRPGQEFFDAREKQRGWSTVGHDDSEWESVSSTSGPPGDLAPQRVQPIVVHDTIEPVEMWEPDPGIYVFDLGQMIAGWPELTVEGESGTKVKLREGEKLEDDDTVGKINYASADCLWQEYILEGEGEETWEPRFTYGGFRYVQVEGYPGEPSLDSIRGRVVHTAVDEGETGSFQSSNDLLNRLHKNTRWAMLNNLHGQHTDSPTWEKLGWTETNIEMAESLSANFSMTRFWEKFLQDCRDSQLDNGDIPYVVPHEGVAFGGFGDRNDPGWDAATVITAWHAYRYTGDQRILADHYQSMKEYVRFVQSNAENGTIVRSGLGDWASPAGAIPPEGPDITSTSCYYQSVEILAKTAQLLGHSDDAAEFGALRQDIRSAFNAEFFDAEEEKYRTGNTEAYRQTSNLYPLALDIVPEDHREAVAENLARHIRRLDGHLNTGAHGLMHLLPVLSEHGYHELAYEVATQTTYPSQGYWLEEDITALLEFWPLDARSRTHDFLGSIEEWFFQYLAGLRNPVKPGFEEIEIAPLPVSDLDWAEASINTIRGPLRAQWKRKTTSGTSRTRDGLSIEVTIPGNSTATVRLPTLGGEKVRIRESSETVWNNGNQTSSNHPGIGGIEREENRIAVEVGSGEYKFELEQLGEAREEPTEDDKDDDDETGEIVIDDFEDGSLSEYSGDKSAYTIDETSPVYHGSSSLKTVENTDGGNITSLFKLADYPSAGDEIRFDFQLGSADDLFSYVFGAQAERGNPANRYDLHLDAPDDQLILYRIQSGNSTALARSSIDAEKCVGGWVEARVDWGVDGTISCLVLDPSSETELARVSAPDSTFTGGGTGFRSNLGGESTGLVVDYLRTI